MKYKAYRNGVAVAEELDNPTYKHTGLSPATEYTFQFSAYNAEGESPLSEALHVTTADQPATGVSITPATISLKVGGKQKPTVVVQPINATDKTVKYTSSAPAVASVSDIGEITALKNGTATVTVTTNSEGNTSSTVVTVTTDVTNVTLAAVPETIEIGGTHQLVPTIVPATASNKAVTYVSATPAVATVSTTGLVTAKSAGTSKVTVKTTDGNKTAEATITVAEATEE